MNLKCAMSLPWHWQKSLNQEGTHRFFVLLIIAQHGFTIFIITTYNYIYSSSSSSVDNTEGGSPDGINPHDSMSSSVINLGSIALNRFPMNCRRWIYHSKMKFVLMGNSAQHRSFHKIWGVYKIHYTGLEIKKLSGRKFATSYENLVATLKLLVAKLIEAIYFNK